MLKSKRGQNKSFSLYNFFPKNRKGQVGETMSWVIATIVIIGILILFIYISILISKTKAVGILNLKTDLGEEPKLLMQKTSFSHQLAGNKNKELIDSILDEENS